MAHVRRHPKSPNRWQVRYLDPDGRERSKNFARKLDADNYASSVTTDVLRGEYIDPAAGRVTVGEYVKLRLGTRTRLAQATRDRESVIAGHLIAPTFGRRPAASVRPSEVAAWVAALGDKGLSVDYRRKALRLLWHAFEIARRDGAMRTNPAGDINIPDGGAEREGRALSDAELKRLLAAAAAYDQGRLDEAERAKRTPPLSSSAAFAQVVTLGVCGLRWGELAGLRRADVDLAGAMLHIRRSMSRSEGARPVKGRSSEDDGRSIPMPTAAVDALRRHLDSDVVDLGGWVFTSPRGGPLKYSSWRQRTWGKVVEAADLAGLRPHDLRHTVATRLFVVDRWTPAEVQAFLGHRDPRTTLKIYAHVDGKALPRPSSVAL